MLLSEAGARRRYVMLMSTLPGHGALFAARRTPLSRRNLERRLDMLEPADRRILREVERVVQWDALGSHLSDAEMVRRADAVLERLGREGLATLARAVRHRFEIRTAVAALRRRHRGLGPPAEGEVWGVGRWTGHMAEHWDETDFGLGRAFDWLNEAEELLEADDPRGFEGLLLGRIWRDLARLGTRHHFDFTAVALYVLRWDVIDRWTRMDAPRAARRFEGRRDAAEAAAGDPLAEAANG